MPQGALPLLHEAARRIGARVRRMPTLLVLVGIPGSGKTTFAAQLCAANPAWHWINQDELGDRKACECAVRGALAQGRSPIVDRCNFSDKQRATWTRLAQDMQGAGSVQAVAVQLLLPLELCIQRVQQRTGHRTLLPQDAEEVCTRFFRDFELVRRHEAFQEVHSVYTPDQLPAVMQRLQALHDTASGLTLPAFGLESSSHIQYDSLSQQASKGGAFEGRQQQQQSLGAVAVAQHIQGGAVEWHQPQNGQVDGHDGQVPNPRRKSRWDEGSSGAALYSGENGWRHQGHGTVAAPVHGSAWGVQQPPSAAVQEHPPPGQQHHHRYQGHEPMTWQQHSQQPMSWQQPQQQPMTWQQQQQWGSHPQQRQHSAHHHHQSHLHSLPPDGHWPAAHQFPAGLDQADTSAPVPDMQGQAGPDASWEGGRRHPPRHRGGRNDAWASGVQGIGWRGGGSNPVVNDLLRVFADPACKVPYDELPCTPMPVPATPGQPDVAALSLSPPVAVTVSHEAEAANVPAEAKQPSASPAQHFDVPTAAPSQPTEARGGAELPQTPATAGTEVVPSSPAACTTIGAIPATPLSSAPILLFDLNGTLTSHTAARYGSGTNKPRPGTHLLLKLKPMFRLGIFTSATIRTAATAVSLLEAAAGVGPGGLFEPGLVLHRMHTMPLQDGAKRWDTVKPLSNWFARLHRLVLFDDDAHKARAEEEGNLVLVPRWMDDDQHDTLLQELVQAVLEVLGPLSPQADVREHTKEVNARLQSKAEAAAPVAEPDVSLNLVQESLSNTAAEEPGEELTQVPVPVSVGAAPNGSHYAAAQDSVNAAVANGHSQGMSVGELQRVQEELAGEGQDVKRQRTDVAEVQVPLL